MTDRNRVRLSKLSVALIAALAAAPVFAQSTSAGVGGRVVDGSGQPVAGAGVTDYATLARGAGIKRVYSFDSLDAWTKGAAEALSGAGPAVIWLRVEGRLGQKTPKAPRPMSEQIARLREALGVE